ncbi:DUF342 domain-containing protein [Pseudoflavonifractor sp. 60]|uniref:DUF342 domain-containing protein n=1 Tax=Pseudoflavonifractor sp. 60 TaxID=2304576 RepID=UPI00136D04F0|nr:FapA family protein [Pseudoflavonifractor sp. 60]NBI68663.1 DUF342 domain-containing protein [Pseudoflavonifractor sp. 60]
MALESFFARLFGSEPEESEESEETQEEQLPQEAPPSPQSQVPELNLSPEHAVNQLWSLRQSALPFPKFQLEGWEFMEDAKVQSELGRLQLAVTMAANRRLAEHKKEGEQPPNLDAQVVVFLSGDKLFAWLFAFPPVGEGAELTQEMLEGALKEKNVCFGLTEGLLERLPQAEDRYYHLFLAARGTPVIHGIDGRVVDLFNRVQERVVTLDEFNRVDYTSINAVQNVEKGGVICRIIPPNPGVPGHTVLNEEIPPKEGKVAVAPKGRNTELSEDGSRLVASRTGHVEFNGRTFQVKPVLEIGGNVDFSTGNINFLGDIHIQGDICTGFEVRAMGNIVVEGVVEASTVEAGGDLIMVKGAQGGNQAVLRANHSLFAKYLENCCVYARENLQTDCIINCDVYCDGVVEVRSGRGTIIGGSVWAAREVKASIVGARSECHTDIFLGGLPCQDFDRELLLREISSAEEKMAQVEQQPDSPTKLTQMGKLRMQLSLNRMKLEQASKELEQQEESQEDQGLRRLTCGVAYPGTSLTIGSATSRTRHEVHACMAMLVGDEISWG